MGASHGLITWSSRRERYVLTTPRIGDHQVLGEDTPLSLPRTYAAWLHEHENVYATQPLPEADISLSVLLVVPEQCSREELEATLGSIHRQTVQAAAIYAVCARSILALLTEVFAAQEFECGLELLAEKSEHWYLALRGCRDTWVSVLWAGDVARPWMLAEVTRCVAANADLELAYCDWDHRGPSGPTDPVFTPAWSPVLLESVNYVGSRCFVRCDRASRAAGSGSWSDWHAFLKSVAQAGAAVAHIPAPLVSIGVPFLPLLASPLLLDHESMQDASVSILIPTRFADEKVLHACLRGLLEGTDYGNLEIILLANNLANGKTAPSWLQDMPVQLLHYDGPFNWSAINNAGAELARGDYLLFLNDDIEVVDARWLSAMVHSAAKYQAAVVGPLLVYPSGRIQHGGINFVYHGGGAQHLFRGCEPGQGHTGWLASAPREVSGITGACMLVGKSRFKEIGGFDPRYALVSNDTDFCLRARQRGWTILVEPRARLVHHEGLSRGGMEEMPDVLRFWEQWEPALRAGDEYWNPNLSMDDDGWQLDPHLARRHRARISRSN
jgi:O-antigen biosynthesis protein